MRFRTWRILSICWIGPWVAGVLVGCSRPNPGAGGTGGANAPADEEGRPADTLPELPSDDQLEGTPNADYLDTLTLARVRTGGQVFLVWVADEDAERTRGLMYVTDEELAPLPDGRGRGMLFVWNHDTTTGFWMRNTITPLDVAFVRDDGTIVTIHTMTPLDESTYPPDGPYRFALEVPAGTFDELGVAAGQVVEFL